MTKLHTLTCPICRTEFTRTNRDYNRLMKSGSIAGCSTPCRTEIIARKTRSRKQVECATCKRSLTRTPSDIKQSKSGKFFCNHSCTAIYLNREGLVTKRSPQGQCKECDTKIRKSRKYCEMHRRTFRSLQAPQLQKITLGELKERYAPDSVRTTNGWVSAKIRDFCRTWNKVLKNMPCQKCGYSAHVEYCHIKPIRDFKEGATLGEINDRSNVLKLCPNHHWEFDNGRLHLNELTGAEN